MQSPGPAEYVARLDTTDATLCWWCGSIADSREHRIKRTDLRRIRGSQSHIYWATGMDQWSPINGLNARRVKFPKSLCKKCNSQHGQSFDDAYDKFSEYTWTHANDLRYRTHIDMKTVYDTEATENTNRLLRYFIKHFGCRIHEAGFRVPIEFPEFLNGGPLLPHVQLGFFKDIHLYRYRSRAKAAGYDARGGFLGALMIKMNEPGSKAVFFASEHVVGTIGVLFAWDAHAEIDRETYLVDELRLYRRVDIPLLEMRTEWPQEIFEDREDEWMKT